VSSDERFGRAARPLFEVILEKLYLLGLAAFFFCPLAAVGSAPPGSPAAKTLLAVLAVLAICAAYLAVILLVGWLYHSRRDKRGQRQPGPGWKPGS
jgi:hypothetical protein